MNRPSAARPQRGPAGTLGRGEPRTPTGCPAPPRPSRYDARARARSRRRPRSPGTRGHRPRRPRGHRPSWSATPSSSRSTRPWVERPTARRLDAAVDARRGDRAAPRSTLAEPLERRAGHAPPRASAASLNDKLRGFYRSTFTDDDGAEQVIATTQIEATDCRRAFPCWDEPELQGRLRRHARRRRRPARHLQRRRGRAASATGDGKVRVTFADTMTMSTYLVAFIVGPLEATEPVDVDGTPLRVVHVPGKGHLTAFALEVGAFALRLVPATTTASPTPATRSTSSPCPTSPSAPWRTSAASPSARALLLVDPATATQQERAARRRRHRPRAGPHVVRRPRHHEVVERHLAERGLRHVHGDRGVRRLPARLGALGAASASSARRPSTPTRSPPPARSSTRSCRRPTPRACSTSSPTRRAARSCACSSSTSARSASATASATTSPSTATATPRPPTCGTPSRRPPASRCAASWTPGSSRAATRS